MRVVIQENYDKMCKWAADYIAGKINAHKEDRPFVLGLPTGSSPLGVYAELAKPTGPIGRASLAVSGMLQNRDYFTETREAMRALKNLSPEELIPWTFLLDRLYESGLKVTVTGPENKDKIAELFTIVNSDLLK